MSEREGSGSREVRRGGEAGVERREELLLQYAAAAAPAESSAADPITSNLYNEAEKGALPDNAVKASLGCGNPTALARPRAGETVLDLGSGGGIDVLLSAKRVGPTARPTAWT